VAALAVLLTAFFAVEAVLVAAFFAVEAVFVAAFVAVLAVFVAAFVAVEAVFVAVFFAGDPVFVAGFFAEEVALAAVAFLAGTFLAGALAGAFFAVDAAFLAGAAVFFTADAFLAGADFFVAATCCASLSVRPRRAGYFFFAAFLTGAADFFAAGAAFFAAAFLAFSAAFSVLLDVNFMRVEAAIFTAAPVCGLRPVRAAEFEVLNEPKPGHATLSPPLAAETTWSKKAPRVFSASALLTPAEPATASISSAFVMWT
jgi:hypothetical protein